MHIAWAMHALGKRNLAYSAHVCPGWGSLRGIWAGTPGNTAPRLDGILTPLPASVEMAPSPEAASQAHTVSSPRRKFIFSSLRTTPSPSQKPPGSLRRATVPQRGSEHVTSQPSPEVLSPLLPQGQAPRLRERTEHTRASPGCWSTRRCGRGRERVGGTERTGGCFRPMNSTRHTVPLKNNNSDPDNILVSRQEKAKPVFPREKQLSEIRIRPRARPAWPAGEDRAGLGGAAVTRR